MKKLIIPILFLVILSSCTTQKDYITKTDGTTMSKRQFDRWCKKNSRIAWKSLNKEEKDLLKNTKIEFTYGEQKNEFIPKIEISNESKWYCFYVHDIELDMKYTDCYENDSTKFRKYHKEERYVILDTLSWGTPNPK